MKFNLEAARASGATDDEIVEQLSKKLNFRLDLAVKDGHKKSDMLPALVTKINGALTPEQALERQRKDALKAQSESLNPLESAAVGTGRALVSMKDAVVQAKDNLFGTPEQARSTNARIADEARLYGELAEHNPIMKAAEIGTSVGTSLGVGGAVKAGVKKGAPKLAEKIAEKQLSSAGVRTASVGGVGAAEGLIQPVIDADDANEDFIGSKGMQAGMGAAIGAGVSGAASLINAEPAKDFISGIIKRSKKTEDGRYGAELNQELEGAMTLGQETGNKTITMLENLARQSPWVADEIFQHDKKVAEIAQRRVGKFVDSLQGRVAGEEMIGLELQEATKKAVSDIVQFRKMTAEKDYGLVHRLAGEKPVIKFDNVIEELNNIIAEGSGVAAGDAKKAATQAKAMLRTFQPTRKMDALMGDQSGSGVMLNVTQAMKNRSAWSKGSKGQGNVFKDLSTGMDRALSARLARAAGKDFENVEHIPDDMLKEALDYANKNYQDYSNSITAVEKSVLGKLIGKDVAENTLNEGFNTVAGETAIKRLLRSEPSEMRTAVNILNSSNPETVKNIKTFVIADALRKGSELAPSVRAQGIKFSPNQYIKHLPQEEMLSAIGFSKKEIKESNRIVDAFLRLGDRTGYNSSQTDVRNEVRSVSQALAQGISGVLTGSLNFVTTGASMAGQKLGIEQIARAMTSEEGRRLLQQSVRVGVPRTKAERLLTILLTDQPAEAQ